jgi:predicted nucleic acid-binding protein
MVTDVVSRLLRGSLTNDVAERLTGAVLLVTFVTVGELFRGAAMLAGGRKGSPP